MYFQVVLASKLLQQVLSYMHHALLYQKLGNSTTTHSLLSTWVVAWVSTIMLAHHSLHTIIPPCKPPSLSYLLFTVRPQQVRHLTNECFFFEKISLSKIEFLNFCFLAKKISEKDLKQLRSNKMLQKKFILFSFFCLQNFLIFTFFQFQKYFRTNLLWYYGIYCRLLNSLPSYYGRPLNFIY